VTDRNNLTNQKLPAFIRRDVERAIEDALHPSGMSTHDGKARIGVDRLQYLLRMIDGPQASADVLEFLRAFIAGGSQQDFKLWAGELYQKLYRVGDEPTRERVCADSADGNHVLKQDGPFSIVYCDACGMNKGFRSDER
jgi:hypothetical protein